MRLLSLPPDDSLTIREMALSIGFQDLVSLPLTIQASGFWLLPWCDALTEGTSFRWTHLHAGLARRTNIAISLNFPRGRNWSSNAIVEHSVKPNSSRSVIDAFFWDMEITLARVTGLSRA